MNKRIISLILALLLLSTVGCSKADDETNDPLKGGATSGGNTENGGETNENIELQDGEVVFRGKVTSVDSNRYIEMEIVDSEIAFGTYWVLVGEPTELYGRDGQSIARDDIKVGDTIAVVFSGQVMNSYPPQISAKRIYLV